MSLQATRDEIEYRISELIEDIKWFIQEGDDIGARTWGTQIAHNGNCLLDNPE